MKAVRHIPELTKNDKLRFLKKVNNIGGGCWEWGGCLYDKKGGGYGGFSIGGKPFRAHRIAWVIKNGEIKNGLQVLHKCDNPKCCRPDHLFLGTSTDNMQDCAFKKRNTMIKHPEKASRGDAHYSRRRPEILKRGEDNWNSKITKEDVLEIRRLHSEMGFSSREIAVNYLISCRSIRDIISRITWRHVK